MEINWPQLLQDYGPFALLPFAFFAIERTAMKRARDEKLPETTRNRVYAAAWIMIFILCGVVVTYWWLNRPAPKEAMLRGRVSGLGFSQRLRATGPEMANVRVFTYRDPQQMDQLFWRTFSTDPLDEQTELTFLIDSSTKNSDDTWSYPFRASRRFYSSSMDLHFRYDMTKKSLTFENPPNGKPEELTGQPIVLVADASSGVPRIGRLPWFGTVMAQTSLKTERAKFSADTVIANLDADDPLIRLTARKQLAFLGPDATSVMDNALASLDTSYRVKLGAIVAANRMPEFEPEAFSTLAWCEVWRAAQTGDETMKTQANLLLKKQPKPINTSSCMDRRRREYQRRTVQELKAYQGK